MDISNSFCLQWFYCSMIPINYTLTLNVSYTTSYTGHVTEYGGSGMGVGQQNCRFARKSMTEADITIGHNQGQNVQVITIGY